MSELRIVAWKSYDEATENDPPNVGDMGGCVDGTGWDAYIDGWREDIRPYYEAIRAEVLRNRIWKDGNWHQGEGCPVFEDGTVAAMSMRAWGDMMASIYNERFGLKLWYGDFAWRIDATNPWDGEERVMRPETIDFYGHKLVKEERDWYRATSAAWGEIELSPYSRPERGQWIATWECSPTAYGYAEGYGDTPEQALADLGAQMRAIAGALWVFFPRKADDDAT